MPRTGRPRTPTALKLAKGERRPSRHNSAEPELPAPKRIDPPTGLKGPGLKEWLRVAPLLLEAGVLTEPDMPALEDYCRRMTDLRACEREAEMLRKLLARVEKQKGEVDVADLVRLMRGIDSTERRLISMQAQVNVLRRELGATPSSRSGVRAVKKPEKKEGAASRYMSAIKGGRS